MMSDKGHYDPDPDGVTLGEYLKGADLTGATPEFRAWWSTRVTKVTVRCRHRDERIES